MTDQNPSNLSALEIKLRERIRQFGPIRFDEFMQSALYDPDHGYYCRNFSEKVGKTGDFFTSVSVGSLLGNLIAFQAWDWSRGQNPENTSSAFRLLECGAHDGSLAADVLEAAQKHTEPSGEWPWLQYWILETSPAREELQRETLISRLGGNSLNTVNWVRSWEDAHKVFEHHQIPGLDLIFCNELLDAFPIRRFKWNSTIQLWEEQCVIWNETTSSLDWGITPGSAFKTLPAPTHAQWLENKNPNAIPDGFIAEWSDEAEQWWRSAAGSLAPGGRLWTLDYGHETDRFWEPARANGTLRGYRNHQYVESVLMNPGEQDLTAAVHFTAIRETGEDLGLITETMSYETQAKNLTEIFKKLWIWKEKQTDQSNTPWANFEWTPKLNRQFQTLTHPEQLGAIFRALIQRKPLES